mgnify:CR=1 FL=1
MVLRRFSFDFAGKKRNTYPVIERGILKGLLYDSSTCARYNREQTGHTTGSASLKMVSGSDSADILEATVDMGKVLWIPALHYLNIPNTSQGIFTGSSRFNAVLIENGKIVGSGTYLVLINAKMGNKVLFQETKKMTLIK